MAAGDTSLSSSQHFGMTPAELQSLNVDRSTTTNADALRVMGGVAVVAERLKSDIHRGLCESSSSDLRRARRDEYPGRRGRCAHRMRLCCTGGSA